MTTFEYQKIDIPRVEEICRKSRDINSPDKNMIEGNKESKASEIIISGFKLGDFTKEEAEILLLAI